MSSESLPVWRSVTWWIGVVIFFAAIAAVAQAFTFDSFGRIFPIFIGTPIALIALLHTVLGLTRGVRVAESETATPQRQLLGERLKYFAWIGFLLVAFALAGPVIGIPLFIFLFMLSQREPWWLALIIALAVAGFVYFVMQGTMHVSFPTPLIERWFFR